MKRRQFSAMLVTTTLSLGGLAGTTAGASTQGTEPLQVEDASFELGGVTASVGRAELTFQDGTMQFQTSDWTMESAGRSLATDSARLTVEDVSAETYATVRSGMVESAGGRSPSPLADALAEADVNPGASVGVSASTVEMDGQLVVDQITATGTVESVVPEGTREVSQDGASVDDIATLGPSEWDQLTVTREGSELVLTDVVMGLDAATLSITAADGTAELPERSLELNDVTMTVRPPESEPQEHVEFVSRLRQLAADEELTASEIQSAAAESGVNVTNTEEAVQNARFDMTLGEVTEDGETLISNFETRGTLAELAAVLGQQF